MASSFSADIEKVSIPVNKYIFEISSGGDTLAGYPQKARVADMVRGAIQVYDRRLRLNINLGQRDFAEASDQVARELAELAYAQGRSFSDPLGGAHLFRMASGAERVSRNNLGSGNEAIKIERAALELIYMADAVKYLGEAGKSGLAWRLEQKASLKEAYQMIKDPVAARVEGSLTDLDDPVPWRLTEAYKRGSVIVADI